MDEDIVIGSVLNILVVGFHHKRGCQVDFCFPPLFEDKGCESRDLPPQWKHLPCLALPDGAHNFEKDTIFFLLPGIDDTKNTVYGISCYKQMRTNDLIRKSSEVTRGTVQKSVVILSKLPLFGLIHVKLQLITHAYFAERDFSKINILKEFYNSLNCSLPRSIPDTGDAQILVGLSLVELVKQFKHKVLILFKLMLLEKRVLFFGSPVHDLCTCVLSVASLFPEMIQGGLTDAACPRFYKVKTPTFALEDFGIKTDDYFNVDMTSLPNYRHQKTNVTNRSSSLPNNDNQRTQKMSAEELANQRLGINKYSQSERLSRSVSHDSGVKSIHKQSSPSVGPGAMTMGTSLTEIVDDEDELLSMIDEELFGAYFEKKRKGKERSLSDSHAKRQEIQMDDVLDTDEASDSPNEMSSLLSVDPLSTNEKNAENTESKTLCLPDDATKLVTETDGHSESTNDAEIDGVKDEDGKEADRLSEEGKSDGDETVRKSDKNVPVNHSLQEDNANNRIMSESGIGLTERQQLEDGVDASSQNTVRSTDGILRPSSLMDYVVLPDLPSTPNTAVDDFGFPLSLFGKGALCHPYMALQQHDLLQDISVRCFMIGASNVLFKHKRQMLDVIVEIETGEVNILDQELKKHLSLTTADLRFSDYIVNSVMENHSDDTDINNTGWEGGEEWIRAQFKLYLLSLLATCADNRPHGDQNWGDFNENFIAAWKVTHNHRIWKSQEHAGIDQVHTRHICHGQLSINDMKIRWNSAIQSSERGKNLNNVINRTSVAVSNTGKAVGEAWSSAKSVVSTWLFGFGGDDDDDLWSYEQE